MRINTKNILILAVVLFCGACISNSNSSAQITTDSVYTDSMVVFENEYYSIEYPSQWQPLLHPAELTDVIFMSPNTNILLSIVRIPNIEMSLDEIMSDAHSNYKGMGWQTKSEIIVFNGLRTYKDITQIDLSGQQRQEYNYTFVTKEKTFYDIKFHCSTNQIQECQSIVEKMLYSFKLKSQSMMTTQHTQTASSWISQSLFNNAFSIAVPNTVERRNKNDAYTLRLDNYNPSIVVFQQKGLAKDPPNPDLHYCRIMLQYAKGTQGDYLRSNQTEVIDNDAKAFLRNLVIIELGGNSLVAEPTYHWIDIDNIKAMEIKYRRTGNNNHNTSCTMYLLFNYDEMVKMIVAYREDEKDLWLPDLDNVIKTFQWQ